MFLCSADCAKGRQPGRSADARNRTAAGSRAQSAASVAALPETLEEQPVKWRLHQEPYGLWILCLTIAGTGLISFAYDHDWKRRGSEAGRARIGLSVLFSAIDAACADWNADPTDFCETFQRKRGCCLRRGAPDVSGNGKRNDADRALERFGKRTRLPQYKKCAALLAQNIRRGTGELITALGQEAENAFEEQKAAARRKAEEAQTKIVISDAADAECGDDSDSGTGVALLRRTVTGLGNVASNAQ